MTFGIAFNHPMYAGIVTDRRASSVGRPPNDEYEKAGVVEFNNGRFAYTLTGLAAVRNDETSKWLSEELGKASVGGVDAEVALRRLALAMRNQIKRLRVRGNDRMLTVVFTGFELDAAGSDRRVVYLVSNCSRLDQPTGTLDTEVTEKFEVSRSELPDLRCIAFAVGSGRSNFTVKESLVDELARRLSEPNIPPPEAIEVAVRLIRKSADQYVSGGCTSILIPRDWYADMVSDYHPEHGSTELRFPAYVRAVYGTAGAFVARNGLTSYMGTPDKPALVTGPRPVNKNEKCWCESGKKFKQCHRKKAASRNVVPAHTTGIDFGIDILRLANPDNGRQLSLPPQLFLPGTNMDQYKVTNMRTNEVVQDPSGTPTSPGT